MTSATAPYQAVVVHPTRCPRPHCGGSLVCVGGEPVCLSCARSTQPPPEPLPWVHGLQLVVRDRLEFSLTEDEHADRTRGLVREAVQRYRTRQREQRQAEKEQVQALAVLVEQTPEQAKLARKRAMLAENSRRYRERQARLATT